MFSFLRRNGRVTKRSQFGARARKLAFEQLESRNLLDGYSVTVLLDGGYDTVGEAVVGAPVAAGSCHQMFIQQIQWQWQGMGPPPATDVQKITWIIPSLPTIFESWYHHQSDADELDPTFVGPPSTFSQVHPVVTPIPESKVQSIGFCVGPVTDIFSFTVTVTLTTGETGSDTNWVRSVEQHATGTIVVHPPAVMPIPPGNPGAGTTVLTPSRTVVIEVDGDPNGPDGLFAFVQKVDVVGYFKLFNGDEWNRNTQGYRVDYGSTDEGFLPLPDNVPVFPAGQKVNEGKVAVDLCDPKIVGWCAAVDQPYVALNGFQKNPNQIVQIGYYSFRAEVTVMFIPDGGLSEWVPVAKANWYWSASVVYDVSQPHEYRITSMDTSAGSPASQFTETDEWPSWVYDSGDADGWWSRGPLIL